MGENSDFQYYYGAEAEQYAFYRIPKLLITDPRFSTLSTDAKLLYGLMLDRMSLSVRNGWLDDNGRVYIYFTLKDIDEQLCCKRDKAMKLLAELDSEKGIGLIERVRQGQGRPARIYVMCFFSVMETQTTEKGEAEPKNDRRLDFGKAEVKRSEKPKSRLRKNRLLEVGNSDPSNNNINKTDINKTNLSIYPAPEPRKMTDENGLREETKAHFRDISPPRVECVLERLKQSI